MRHRFRALLVAAIAAFAAAVIVAPDLAMAGCGGGRHRGHHGDPGDGNDNGHHGRGHHNPGGGDDGSDDNDGPRHHGRGGHGGVDVGVGVDVGPDYGPGYGHGLIGPPTAACAELDHMRSELAKLFNLRTQINSGKRLISTTDSGQHRVVSARNHRRELSETMEPSSGTNNGDAQQLANIQVAMAQARDQSLEIIDAQIAATQNRVSQLEYECQE